MRSLDINWNAKCRKLKCIDNRYLVLILLISSYYKVDKYIIFNTKNTRMSQESDLVFDFLTYLCRFLLWQVRLFPKVLLGWKPLELEKVYPNLFRKFPLIVPFSSRILRNHFLSDLSHPNNNRKKNQLQLINQNVFIRILNKFSYGVIIYN